TSQKLHLDLVSRRSLPSDHEPGYVPRVRRYMDDGRLEIASAGIEYGPLSSVFRVDLAVLAGVIDRSIKGVLWERGAFLSVPELYVAGNNEHYYERIGRLHQRPREAAAGLNALPNQR